MKVQIIEIDQETCNWTGGWYVRWHEQFTLRGNQLEFSTPRRKILPGLRRPIDLGWQEFYTFDLSTGNMLTSQVRGRWLLVLYCLSILLPFCWIVFFVVRRGLRLSSR